MVAVAASQHPVSGCNDEPRLDDSLTLLDAALHHALERRAEIAWLITDNVQDDGKKSREAKSTRSFYELLNAPGVGIAQTPLAPMPEGAAAR